MTEERNPQFACDTIQTVHQSLAGAPDRRIDRLTTKLHNGWRRRGKSERLGTAGREVSWTVETNGRIWEGLEAKDAAISEWCRNVSEQTRASWSYVRVNQTEFGSGYLASFADLLSKIARRNADGVIRTPIV